MTKRGARRIARVQAKKAIVAEHSFARHPALPSFRVHGNGSANYPLFWLPQSAGQYPNPAGGGNLYKIDTKDVVCQPDGAPLPGYAISDLVNEHGDKAPYQFWAPSVKVGQNYTIAKPWINDDWYRQNFFGITLNPFNGITTDPERIDLEPRISKLYVDLQVQFPALSIPVAATQYVPRMVHYEILYLPESRWSANPSLVDYTAFPYGLVWGTPTGDADASKISGQYFMDQYQGLDALYNFKTKAEGARWMNPQADSTSFNMPTYGGFGVDTAAGKQQSISRMYPTWAGLKRRGPMTVEPDAYRPDKPRRIAWGNITERGVQKFDSSTEASADIGASYARRKLKINFKRPLTSSYRKVPDFVQRPDSIAMDSEYDRYVRFRAHGNSTGEIGTATTTTPPASAAPLGTNGDLLYVQTWQFSWEANMNIVGVGPGYYSEGQDDCFLLPTKGRLVLLLWSNVGGKDYTTDADPAENTFNVQERCPIVTPRVTVVNIEK